MKDFVISAILVALFLGGSPFPKNDPWFAKDKSLHFSVSFTLYNFFYVGTGDKNTSLELTLAVGVFKELVDLTIRKTGFSYKDLLYDMFGALLAHET